MDGIKSPEGWVFSAMEAVRQRFISMDERTLKHKKKLMSHQVQPVSHGFLGSKIEGSYVS
jgi:hypothetical protein